MPKKQIAPNLLLFTRQNGKSFYIAKFKKNGRAIERSLGSTEDISLRNAKLELARLMLDFNDEAEDLVQNKKDGLSFREAAEQAIKDIALVKQWKTDRSEHQWRQTLNDYAFPVIGDLDVATITRKDVLAVLSPLWFEKAETASRLRMRIEAIINWSIHHNFRTDSNPAVWRGNLEFDLPSRNKVKRTEHHSAMTLDEIKQAVSYCLSHPSPVSAAILFGIATATRVSEFRWARHSEIEGDVWFIPPERRKDTKTYPHRVPLSTLAKMALDMAKGEDFIFVSKFGVIAADSPRLKLIDIIKRPVTMHGCRSTFRDWCAEGGIDRVLAEKSLMHATGNEVEQAYQRADLLEQRRPVMQQWADYLLSSNI